MRTLLIALFIITIHAILVGCASNPATGGTDLVLMSQSEEIKIGREMHEEFVQQGALYPDPDQLEQMVDYVISLGPNE